jgi:thiamine-phosphate pyrophosphorylase
MKVVPALHFITLDIPGYSHVQQAEDACRLGVRLIQLRMKNAAMPELLSAAIEIKKICQKFNAVFIVNDYVQVALEIGAHGVHLGKKDMSVSEARKILGNNFIIGGTANTSEDLKNLSDAGADYSGLGPFRFTTTKENLSAVLGTTGYTSIMEYCRTQQILFPVIAIGGILPSDVPALMKTGIHGVAVSSAIAKATDRAVIVNQFLTSLEKTTSHE